jgi:hypothetical protein
MTYHSKLGWSLAAALALGAAASCGRPAPPRAAYAPPAAATPSLAKGPAPGDSLPSLVVEGDVAPYRPAAGEAGPPKDRSAANSLPSHLSETGRAALPAAGR